MLWVFIHDRRLSGHEHTTEAENPACTPSKNLEHGVPTIQPPFDDKGIDASRRLTGRKSMGGRPVDSGVWYPWATAVATDA